MDAGCRSKSKAMCNSRIPKVIQTYIRRVAAIWTRSVAAPLPNCHSITSPSLRRATERERHLDGVLRGAPPRVVDGGKQLEEAGRSFHGADAAYVHGRVG